MEELTLTTPSILFSAISLIMLAYTNRFLAYASVIRSLKTEHEQNPTPMAQRQIDNLRKRLYMARSMQIFGVSSLLFVRGLYAVYLCGMAIGCCIYLRSGFTLVGDFSRYLYP